jgi:uncharacterized protein Smg (DUF494 family)
MSEQYMTGESRLMADLEDVEMYLDSVSVDEIEVGRALYVLINEISAIKRDLSALREDTCRLAYLMGIDFATDRLKEQLREKLDALGSST